MQPVISTRSDPPLRHTCSLPGVNMRSPLRGEGSPGTAASSARSAPATQRPGARTHTQSPRRARARARRQAQQRRGGQLWHTRRVSLSGLPAGPGWPAPAELLPLLRTRPGRPVAMQDVEADCATLLETGLFRRAPGRAAAHGAGIRRGWPRAGGADAASQAACCRARPRQAGHAAGTAAMLLQPVP